MTGMTGRCDALFSGRSYPISGKTVQPAVAEMDQCDGAGLDVGRVEDREVAAVLARTPDHRQQEAVALGCLVVALDEHRLRNAVAGRQQVAARPRSPAVDMDDAGKRAEHRNLRVRAGVPAMTV